MSAPKPRSSARTLFTTTVLVLEAFVVFFAALVAFGLDIATPAVAFGVGAALAVLCLVAAGLVRRGPAGVVLGWVVQALLLASGFVLPTMFTLGGVFTVIWIVSLRTGARIDAERVERERAQPAADGR